MEMGQHLISVHRLQEAGQTGQRQPAARDLAGRPEQEIADFRDFLPKSAGEKENPVKEIAKLLSDWENFANRSPIGTAPENREISVIPTVPATGEAQIGTGVPQATFRTLTRSSSRRRCGAQRPEPPLLASRRRPRYRPTNPPLTGFGPLRFHCRSSPARQPRPNACRGPSLSPARNPVRPNACRGPSLSPARNPVQPNAPRGGFFLRTG
ncbi:hypothetical protein CRG98_003365 [Punica granatum]|uniref:Uncharacterized protein n=1 Tax=Punica granatum TaxID=22663 RepID=A0A2I0L6D3_PUNGR|nr:hypothetical protein CRG98_003365 [Punica granatum]